MTSHGHDSPRPIADVTRSRVARGVVLALLAFAFQSACGAAPRRRTAVGVGTYRAPQTGLPEQVVAAQYAALLPFRSYFAVEAVGAPADFFEAQGRLPPIFTYERRDVFAALAGRSKTSVRWVDGWISSIASQRAPMTPRAQRGASAVRRAIVAQHGVPPRWRVRDSLRRWLSLHYLGHRRLLYVREIVPLDVGGVAARSAHANAHILLAPANLAAATPSDLVSIGVEVEQPGGRLDPRGRVIDAMGHRLRPSVWLPDAAPVAGARCPRLEAALNEPDRARPLLESLLHAARRVAAGERGGGPPVAAGAPRVPPELRQTIGFTLSPRGVRVEGHLQFDLPVSALVSDELPLQEAVADDGTGARASIRVRTEPEAASPDELAAGWSVRSLLLDWERTGDGSSVTVSARARVTLLVDGPRVALVEVVGPWVTELTEAGQVSDDPNRFWVDAYAPCRSADADR